MKINWDKLKVICEVSFKWAEKNSLMGVFKIALFFVALAKIIITIIKVTIIL